MKPGYKTTEFWFTVAAQAVGGALEYVAAHDGGSWVGMLAGVALQAVSLFGYQASRARVKSAHPPA